MSQWLLFFHVAAVLAFMMAHGAHVTITWAWRRESDPERGLTLFNGLPEITGTRVLVLAVIATGLLAGFVGGWWRQWWMWLSLLILLAIWATMYLWGGAFFNLVEAAAERAVEERASGSGSTTAMEAYDVARRAWHPIAMTATGLGGLAAILWLMVFKPL
jgi:hypothetical protein